MRFWRLMLAAKAAGKGFACKGRTQETDLRRLGSSALAETQSVSSRGTKTAEIETIVCSEFSRIDSMKIPRQENGGVVLRISRVSVVEWGYINLVKHKIYPKTKFKEKLKI